MTNNKQLARMEKDLTEILSIARILMLVLIFVLLAFVIASIVSAQEINVTSTINDAILNSSEGDTILIPEGNYTENLLINKSLTLIGQGQVRIIYDWTNNNSMTMMNRNSGIVVYTPHDTNITPVVNFQNLIIDGNYFNESFAGIRFYASNGTINNLRFENFYNDTSPIIKKFEVAVHHFQDAYLPQYVSIRNSIFEQYQTSGISASELGTDLLIENNTFTGRGNQTLMKQYGIQINYGATAQIKNNTLSNHYFIPSYNVSVGEASAILCYGNNVAVNLSNETYYEIVNISQVLIENNVLVNNSYGIIVDGEENFTGGNVWIVENLLYNNLANLYLPNTDYFVLIHNYWGSESPNFNATILGNGSYLVEPYYKDILKQHLSNEVIPETPTQSSGGSSGKKSSGGGSYAPKKNVTIVSNVTNTTNVVVEPTKPEVVLNNDVEVYVPVKKDHSFYWFLFFSITGIALLYSSYRWYKDVNPKELKGGQNGDIR